MLFWVFADMIYFNRSETLIDYIKNQHTVGVLIQIERFEICKDYTHVNGERETQTQGRDPF